MDGSISDGSGKRVVVGLTGRVDSAVAAFLLKKQGFEVIGLTIVTSAKENASESELLPKCHIQDLDSVKAFCESLNITFYATDGKAQFENDVIEPLLANKLTGRANKTCFNCTGMRFEILYNKMIQLKADYFATGHYCKVQKNIASENYFIHSNNDSKCDQSFLLASVNKEHLKNLLLPLGELRKDEVEKIAKRFNLNVEPSNEQSGFCFKKNESFRHYSSKSVPESLVKEGQVLHVDTQNYHGDHEGVLNYYITQKKLDFKGVNPSDKDLEIVGYDFYTGTIEIGGRKNLTHRGGQIIGLVLSSGIDTTKPINCFVKFKYSEEYYSSVVFFKNNNTAQLNIDKEIYPVIKDEVMVLYDRNGRNAKILGHGKLGSVSEFKLLDRAGDYRDKVEDDRGELQDYEVSKFKF